MVRFVDWSTVSRISHDEIIAAKEALFTELRPWVGFCSPKNQRVELSKKG